MQISNKPKVEYESYSTLYNIRKVLKDLDDNYKVLAFDFETTGLGHPAKETITHLAIAKSASEAVVFILQDKVTTQYVLDWLVETNIKQIWHNLCYDGKFVVYYTGAFPKDYEDTQIFAKTLLNHVQAWKANSGLKHLMGYKYGSWAVAPDHFSIDNMFNSTLLLYAATDACATYSLYFDIRKDVE